MANSFSKEERVAFENILEGFNDATSLSHSAAPLAAPLLVTFRR